MDLLPFQKRFLLAVRRHPCAILSVPRGNGKSSFAASLLQACLTPGSSWHQPGRESFLIASSVAQARRTTWGILRAAIEDDPAYRVLDTAQNCTAKHKASGARVSIVASIGKRAYGIVNAPLIIGDEPAGWENGEELWEALWTSLGKPQEVPTRLLLVGTLAPAQPDAWWPALVAAGTTPRRHVTCLRGREDRWDQTSEIRKVNPLMWRFTASRRTLLAERDDARQNPAAEDSFKRQRMNIPGVNADESLLTQADLAGILPRPVPPRHGRPVVGIDLGDSPSWSAAVAIWPNGRTEAVGLTAGIPTSTSRKSATRPAGGATRGWSRTERCSLLTASTSNRRPAHRPRARVGPAHHHGRHVQEAGAARCRQGPVPPERPPGAVEGEHGGHRCAPQGRTGRGAGLPRAGQVHPRLWAVACRGAAGRTGEQAARQEGREAEPPAKTG